MTLLKRLLRYLLNYKANIGLVLIANLLYAVFSIFTLTMLVPFLSVLFGQVQQVVARPSFTLSTGFFIDTFYYYMGVIVSQYGQMSALLYIAIVMVVLSLLSNFFRYLGMFWLAPMRSGILRDLRNDFYHKMLLLPISFYNKYQKGDIISRIGADVLEVEWSVYAALQSLCRDPFQIVIYVVVLFTISVKLALVSLVVLPLMGYLLALIGKRIKRYALRSQQLLGKMSSLFEEAVGGLRVIKGYNAVDHTFQRFRHQNFQFYRTTKKVFRISELGAPLIEFLCIMALLGITMVGLLWVPAESMGQGTAFMLFFVVFARLIVPAKALVSTYYTMQKGLTAATRVYEVIDADEQIVECNNPLSIERLEKEIVFQDVSFSYRDVKDEESCDVLHHINFRVKRGEVVAIVGPSGSGKSTLVDLLPRFYDVKFGQIRIDGKPIQQYRIADLRSLFSMVNQDVVLFNDTVYNNIVFGMDNVTEEQVIAAAKIAQAHQFIMEMEDGYQTQIGDRGMRLSGGQRQRLSIARTILRNPEVLILDEATSALDNESEFLFQEALIPFVKEHTAIIIAHRLSTIRFADKIMFVRDGKIVESGSHEQLMKLQCEYYRFYMAQQ
ncbi:MAG: ABC transporter ATP-binding protein/permease [Bacteroidales bacterium]|nr:ABC transporter ATP-binding protein/permease [Bacteroidales bacterium]